MCTYTYHLRLCQATKQSSHWRLLLLQTWRQWMKWLCQTEPTNQFCLSPIHWMFKQNAMWTGRWIGMNIHSWNSFFSKSTSTIAASDTVTPARQDMKIRNLDVTISRYISTHADCLQQPPPCPHAKSSDLYIHRYGNGKIQVWVRESELWLADVIDGHPHPTLPGYCLYLHTGMEPSWVTRKTRTTYRGRTCLDQKKATQTVGMPSSLI